MGHEKHAGAAEFVRSKEIEQVMKDTSGMRKYGMKDGKKLQLRKRGKVGMVGIVLLSALLVGCGSKSNTDSAAYTSGMKALKSGDYEKALNELRISVDKGKRKAESYRGEGIAYLKQDAYASAITMFERSINAWKKDRGTDREFYEDVRYYQADALVKNGQLDTALGLYADLTGGLQPSLAYLLRGIVYVSNQDIDKAMEDFDKVVKEDPSFDSCLRIYEALSAVGHKVEGAEYLQKALDDKEEDAQAEFKRGMVYYYLGNDDAASKAFLSAYEKGNTNAISMLAKVSLENGDTQSARKVYQDVIDQGKDTAAAYNGLAICDIADGKYEDALEHIQKGIEQGGETLEDLKLNEVIVYEKKSDFSTAKQKIEEFLKSYPNNVTATREAKFLSTR